MTSAINNLSALAQKRAEVTRGGCEATSALNHRGIGGDMPVAKPLE